MIIPQTFVRFAKPVTLSLRLSDGPRARVVPPPDSDGTSDAPVTPPVRDTWDMDFSELPVSVYACLQTRTLVAQMSPIPSPLPIYGPEDFGLACNDTMDEHAERVLEILGTDPAVVLQALIDGSELPAPPPRVPREVAHWRMEFILGKMDKLTQLLEVIEDLPEEQREVARAAWFGLAAINIKSPFILLAAPRLGFSPKQTGDLFIACAAIPA